MKRHNDKLSKEQNQIRFIVNNEEKMVLKFRDIKELNEWQDAIVGQ